MKCAMSLILVGLCALYGWSSSLPVSAVSYVAVDEESGVVLFEHDAGAKRFPASTTKIMTALILLEKCKLDDTVKAPEDCEFVGESSMHLEPGEKIKVKDLLYCILLRSANDGCQIAAIHVSGSEVKFAALMNARARQLGCTDTHFTNPHGLHDPNHYTTARDLALIAREAMKWDEFRTIVGTYKYCVERSLNQDDRWMLNHNKLLKGSAIVDGIKTGYTVPAGKCFVGSAHGDNFRVITVVLGSEDWQADTLTLFSCCYAMFERSPVLPSRHQAGRALVRGGVSDTVEAVTSRPAYVVRHKGQSEKPLVETYLDAVPAPIAVGQRVGSLKVVEDGRVLDEVPLVASRAVAKAHILPSLPWAIWAVPTLVLAALGLRLRRR